MSDAFLHYQKRVRIALRLYAVYLIATIILTLYMGTRANILTTSMSAMGNSGRLVHLFFIAWTIVFCSYFTSMMGFILIMTQNTHSRVRVFVYIAVVIMLIGDLMPFVPDVHPITSWLHNTCAQISSVSLCVSLLLLALSIRHTYAEVFRKATYWVFAIWACLLGLMSLFGTKAITEMSGIIGGSIFLYVFAWWIAKAREFSASEALSAHDANKAEEEARRLEKKARALQEEYLQAQADARQARLAAEELRKAEARIRRHQRTAS